MSFDAATLTRLRREKNRLKWGEQNWPDGTGPSERRIRKRDAAKDEVNAGMRNGTVTYFQILKEEFLEAACEREEHELLAELIDVAAVAQDWADSILRRHQPRAARAAGPQSSSNANHV